MTGPRFRDDRSRWVSDDRPWPHNFYLGYPEVSVSDGSPLPEIARDAIAWCVDQFGPIDRDRWTTERIFAVVSIRFAHQIDAVAFKMRWC